MDARPEHGLAPTFEPMCGLLHLVRRRKPSRKLTVNHIALCEAVTRRLGCLEGTEEAASMLQLPWPEHFALLHSVRSNAKSLQHPIRRGQAICSKVAANAVVEEQPPVCPKPRRASHRDRPASLPRREVINTLAR